MAERNQKDSFQKLKSKVIGKLFCQSSEEHYEAHGSMSESPAGVDLTVTESSSSALSGIGGEIRADEVRLHGAQCCPMGSRSGHAVDAISYSADDESSGSGAGLDGRKRRHQYCSPEHRTRALQPPSSSSSITSHGSRTQHTSHEPSGSSLVKNQRKKLKKRKEREKKPHLSESRDSSSNNFLTTDSSETYKCATVSSCVRTE